MDYIIRPIDKYDYDDLVTLWTRSGLEYRPGGRDSREAMAAQFVRSDSCFLGMYDGDKMIGSVIGSHDGRKGWINRLAIDPDYRGRALAQKLIDAVEGFLHEQGIRVIAALIEDWNTPSLSAFKKAGYDISDKILYCSRRTSADD